MRLERPFEQPVAIQFLRKRIAHSKQAVRHHCTPDTISFVLPIRNRFSPCDDDFPVPGSLIDNPLFLCSSVSRAHPFPVCTRLNSNCIPGLRQRRSAGDGAERLFRRAWSLIAPLQCNMIFHMRILLFLYVIWTF